LGVAAGAAVPAGVPDHPAADADQAAHRGGDAHAAFRREHRHDRAGLRILRPERVRAPVQVDGGHAAARLPGAGPGRIGAAGARWRGRPAGGARGRRGKFLNPAVQYSGEVAPGAAEWTPLPGWPVLPDGVLPPLHPGNPFSATPHAAPAAAAGIGAKTPPSSSTKATPPSLPASHVARPDGRAFLWVRSWLGLERHRPQPAPGRQAWGSSNRASGYSGLRSRAISRARPSAGVIPPCSTSRTAL